MPPSDPDASSQSRVIDWRGWIALAWVVWFGLLYGKMVIERRGEKLGLTPRIAQPIEPPLRR